MIESSEKRKLREATVAGIFYPEEPDALGAEIGRLLDAADPLFAGAPVSAARAVMAPHASLGYSGDLAALAWKASLGRAVSRVVVLCPLHRAQEQAVYLPEAELFETPFGPIPVDHRAVDELLDCGTVFTRNDIPHFEEHGIEMQLPFMKRLFPRASLAPILVGKPSISLVRSLAAALGIVFGERREETLFVISSDLAASSKTEHDEDRDQAEDRAERVLTLIAEGDWKGILELKAAEEFTACGSACLAAWLASPLAADTASRVLGRHDSAASRESERERLVFYAALAFVAEEGGD
ncbi:MAG: AmmeMemoRadiSam system protein B [Spirochaetaceae bacterium]|nr:AmmeMemoRadiSam system protein B [Spirochaetaceae bacterium]